MDLKAESFLVSSVLTVVVAQRICRKICNSCKEVYDSSSETLEDLKKVLGGLFPQNREIKLYKGKGCPDCNNTGYYGRIGMFEILKISEKISKMIIERKSAMDAEKQAMEEGMINMKQDGYMKVIEGITTIEEVLRVSEA